MTLVQLRQKFVEMSGRYDLVVNTSAWADNGANFYINAGQRWLERQVTLPENTAKIFEALTAGNYAITFQHSCRAIQSVFVENKTDRYELTKITLKQLKKLYSEPANVTERGAPAYWAPAELRAVETTAKNSLATFIDSTHAETDTKYNYSGIIVVPPVDETYVVTISGLFGQKVLTVDADTNWWTLEAPDTLLKAALYQLESFSRGTENAKVWLSALETEIFGIEKDAVEAEISDIDAMEG
jgi:hypothetical protein